MTAAQLVTRQQVYDAIYRVSVGMATHDDANLIRAAMQNLEKQVQQLAKRLDALEGEHGEKQE